jgi:hypothetical protein
LNWENQEHLDLIRDYFARILTAHNPDPFRPRGQVDCLLQDVLDPDFRDEWDLEQDHCALCNRCQKHGAIRRGVRSCQPSQCFRKGLCRFHFPYPFNEQPLVFLAEENGTPRKRFAATRNDPWLNQHSRTVLLGWRANVDLQPVLDRQAAIKYVSKYASKPEVLSQSYRDALGDFCSRLPQNLPAENAVRRLFARMAADRDISAQEAVHLLLGEKLVGCSRSFVNLNASVDAPHVLKDVVQLDEDDCTFESAFFAHYEQRPAHLETLAAVDYCRQFDVKRRM